MNARADRFPLFDSLRAIAALGVFGTHAYFALLWSAHSALREYFVRLDVGVSIFFAISGFLLYRPFVKARFAQRPAPRVLAYAWRRLLRLGPAYWVALTVIALWLGLPGVLGRDAPLFYGFGQVYRPAIAIGGLPQAWSLCVEASFYAFLPLYALAMRRIAPGSPRGALAAELAGLVALTALSYGWNGLALGLGTTDHFGKVPLHLMLPGYLNDFALGMLLAVLSVWYQGRELPRWLSPLDRFPALAWMVAVLAFWAVSTRIGLTGAPGEHVSSVQYQARSALYSVVAVALIAPAVFGDQARGLVRRLLANRALLFLGLVSYSFFLWHMAVITQYQRWHFAPPAVVWFVLTFVPSLGIATLSYMVVERPFLGLKRLVRSSAEPAQLEAIAEPAPTPAAVVR